MIGESEMDKWEYKITRTPLIRSNEDVRKGLERMNKTGEKGWELVSIISTKVSKKEDSIEFFFKRKLES